MTVSNEQIFYLRPGKVLQLAPLARAGRVESFLEGKVDPDPRRTSLLGILMMPSVSPMYKPSLPRTRGISRFSVTSQTGLPASDGRGGFTFFFGCCTTICWRPGKVPVRFGRLVGFPARQGRLAKFRLGKLSAPPRPGKVSVRFGSEPDVSPTDPSSRRPTPGSVPPLLPVAGAQAEGL